MHPPMGSPGLAIMGTGSMSSRSSCEEWLPLEEEDDEEEELEEVEERA